MKAPRITLVYGRQWYGYLRDQPSSNRTVRSKVNTSTRLRYGTRITETGTVSSPSCQAWQAPRY
ncbi:hypothetical protein WG66_000080 [Moniliophthora roreri]|nr:hypothetical protein WG66_000080 [Moniliophthora roreri]